MAVKMPKIRDRSGNGVKFNSAIVPPYVRKSPRVSAALPWLYLKGILTSDMSDALQVLLGKEAQGLSANVVSRLNAQWAAEHETWNRRDLTLARYVCWWADGSTPAYSAILRAGNACWSSSASPPTGRKSA